MEYKIYPPTIKIFEQTILNLWIDGEISTADIDDDDSLRKIVKDIANGILPVDPFLCHQTELLNEALEMKDRGKDEIARVIYAAFFEHSINEIIFYASRRKKLNSKLVSKNLIKRFDIGNKLTWISEFLELPVFNKKHLKIIIKLHESRNKFLHYKYQRLSRKIIDEYNERSSKRDLEFILIKNAVKYMQLYQSKVIYLGKKKQFKKIKKFLLATYNSI